MYNTNDSRKIHCSLKEIVMICPVCLIANDNIHIIKNIKYVVCRKCKTIYTTDIISPITENDKSEDRNSIDMNYGRFKRIDSIMPDFTRALDFGCGYGNFVSFLRLNGVNADGVDKTTELTLNEIKDSYYDVIFMVEVIEHLADPRSVLKQLIKSLKSGGLIYIETTFANYIEHIDKCSYVDPDIDHRTIISIKGLRKCLPKNVKIYEQLNDNVVILLKK